MANETYPLTQVKDPSNSGGFHNWNACVPGPGMKWSNPGAITIGGTKWSSGATLEMYGDPTLSSGNYTTLRLNTGANNDCNAVWKCEPRDATERQVRGLFFVNYTNGAKFKPRVSGVALQYATSSGLTKYYDLGYRGSYNVYNRDGDLGYQGTTMNNYFWGVGVKGKYGDPFHDPDYRLSGVLFHFETTWATGSAVNCDVYIKGLRFITDAEQQSVPYYNNLYRVWGWQVK